MEAVDDRSVTDLFKEEFKRYKRRKPLPDFSDVLDFSLQSPLIKAHVLDDDIAGNEAVHRLCRNRGLRPADSWKIFEVPSHPGFYYIVDPFQSGYHRHWVRRCLSGYPHLPNVSNLDAHIPDRPSALWDDALRHRELNAQTWLSNESLIQRLRWVTLGYHYDWTNKVYCKEKVSPMPGDVDELCGVMAKVLRLDTFKAEAGIVNFYHLDSTLSGHTDHSEFDLTAPLFSISFGQDAIFLLGGHDRSTRPLAMFVRSGDAMVMSGASRMAYHSVPRVLATTVGTLDEADGVVSNDAWRPYAEYMHSSRININIRQVLKPGEGFPDNPYPDVLQDSAESCRAGMSTACSEPAHAQVAGGGTAAAEGKVSELVTGCASSGDFEVANASVRAQSDLDRTTRRCESSEPSCKRPCISADVQ